MLNRIKEAQAAVQVARANVYSALNDASRHADAPNVVRHLTAMNYALQSAEFIALDAVDAARGYDLAKGRGTGPERDSTGEP